MEPISSCFYSCTKGRKPLDSIFLPEMSIYAMLTVINLAIYHNKWNVVKRKATILQ